MTSPYINDPSLYQGSIPSPLLTFLTCLFLLCVAALVVWVVGERMEQRDRDGGVTSE